MKRFTVKSPLYRLIIVTPLFLLLGQPIQAIGKAYKFQDKQGQWHYTDRPPKNQSIATEIQVKGQKNAEKADLASSLNNDFPSDKPEKIATLAVVEIKNAIGLGSGFFFSEDGYIVTNKHVVKPTESTAWNKYKQKLARQEELLLNARNSLEQRSAYHDRLHSSLVEYERTIHRVRNRSSRSILEARYNMMLNSYQESERLLNTLKSRYADAKSSFEASQSFLRQKDRESYWAQRYKIRIKNGTQLHAKYIGASKVYDLAFLKLDGYRTPFLRAETNLKKNIQSSRVYAIGSPLGISDSLTSGSVTRVQNDYIYTDTKIFPGSSGGPLINEAGKVLGVITQKVTQGKAKDPGFGRALPISLAIQELSKFH